LGFAFKDFGKVPETFVPYIQFVCEMLSKAKQIAKWATQVCQLMN